MSESFPLMIPGGAPAPEPIEVHSPYDGRLLATAAAASGAAVEQALATAYGLFRDRRAWLTPAERIGILQRTAALMEADLEALAAGAAAEGGKPLADSRVEAVRALEGVRLSAEALRQQGGVEIPMRVNAASAGRFAITSHEPVGVVVAVSAFNHPLNLIVHQVGPAVAAGCPVLVKPADDTPLSCLRFVQLLREAGLPEEWCQVVITPDLGLAEALVTDARNGFLSFIGSARVGWMLRSKLAPGTRCALEHGGAAPVVVAAEADLDAAVPLLLKGGFYHAGQVCVSVQRVFAPADLAEDLAGRLAVEAKRLVVGDPNAEATEVGPLIRPREVERVHQWVQEAVDAGARLLCGGEPLPDNCYAPTVLLDPPPQATISTQEVFGPVVCVYGYEDLEAAIAQATAWISRSRRAFSLATSTRRCSAIVTWMPPPSW